MKHLFIIGAGASIDFSATTLKLKTKEDFEGTFQKGERFVSGKELIEKLKEFDNVIWILYNYKDNICYTNDKNKNIPALRSEIKYDENLASKIPPIPLKSLSRIQDEFSFRVKIYDTYYDGKAISDLSFPIQVLLHELLETYKPLSIDFYVNVDMKHHVSDDHLEHINKLLPEKEKIKSKDQLYETLVNYIKSKITRILQKAQMVSMAQNIEESYFYNILCNYIGLDNIEETHIITFNYDLVLEKTIEYLISRNHLKDRKDKLDSLLTRIHHVYGSIKEGDGIDFIRYSTEKDIPKEEREEAEERRQRNKNLIKDTTHVYFLGFGFEKNNIKNILGLEFPEAKHSNGIMIYGDNFNCRGKIFITNYDKLSLLEAHVEDLSNCELKFVREGTRKCINRKTGYHVYVAEKSISEAIKQDFYFI